jgi:predicted ATPase/transcriptional regulator with XRE-family HTH domain
MSCILGGVAKGRPQEPVTPWRQNTSFGSRLRRFREAAGLTQEELASRAGLSANAVSVLERGERRRPYPHTVRSLADALGLSEGDRAALLAAVPKRGAGPQIASPALGSSGDILPSPMTSLVGRERELRQVGLLLGFPEVRLLTLTGIGGVGKTRLALEAARSSLSEGRFPDGATFVPLAPLSDPALAVPTIARSLGLREADGRSAAEALRDYLLEKRVLLVLDNFEQLLGAAVEVAGLIEACPGLEVLATSRAPLRVRGEQEYPVPPLALPPSTLDPTEDEIVGTPSGRLFVERARAASPSFELTAENASAVAEICWRLAGLPLALELAAAKVRLLDPAALLPRLDQALSTAWARDLPERQRTMRAALDWSYDLLSEQERGLFRDLSVFAGGFTLEAAEAVGSERGGAGEVPEEVLGLLGALAEQSLVTAEASPDVGDGVRYGMLEPVRQYALERLEESGEAEGERRRHAAFFLALAERARGELRGPAQVAWLERLERENGNLRAAMSWALSEAGEAEVAARLGWALWVFWWLRGHQREGRASMETLLGMDLPPNLRARTVQVANSMAYTQGDFEACARYSREALELSRQVEDELCEAYALCGVGLDAMGQGDFREATSRFEEAIALFGRTGEEGAVPVVRVWAGIVLLLEDHREEAVVAFEEGLEQARQRGDRLGTYNALYNLAQLAMGRGDHGLARRMFEEGVALSEQMRDQANLAYFLEGLAVVIGMDGKARRSATLSGAAERLLEEAGAPVYNYYVPDPSLRERALVTARTLLGETAFQGARNRGREMGFEQAVEYALTRAETPPT